MGKNLGRRDFEAQVARLSQELTASTWFSGVGRLLGDRAEITTAGRPFPSPAPATTRDPRPGVPLTVIIVATGSFVSYLRVSTQRQGQSGLGLEASMSVASQQHEAANGARFRSSASSPAPDGCFRFSPKLFSSCPEIPRNFLGSLRFQGVSARMCKLSPKIPRNFMTALRFQVFCEDSTGNPRWGQIVT